MVTNINEAPTDVALSVTSIAENAGTNATVGTLSALDPDANTSLTYALVEGDGAIDNAEFYFTQNKLHALKSLNYEQKQTYAIRIQVSDGSMTHTETFTITVNNINDAPTFTTPSLVLKTNEAKPMKLAASDEDNDALVYSVFLAPKLGKASINAQTGELNYSASAIPASEKIGVRISDGKTNADMTINVLVNQANRAPVFKNQSFTTKNNAAIKGRITGSDADNHRLTYRLLTSPKSGKLFVKSDGLYSYIPDAKFVGKVSFSIVANDGFMDSQPANYSITVQQGVVVLPTHTKYMSGYPDGQFKPNQGVTRAEVATAVVRLTGGKQN